MTKPDVQICKVCGAGETEPHQPDDDDCALPHRYDQREHPPRRAVGVCCTSCIERHKEWLQEIVDLYDDLPDVIPIGAIPDDTAEHGHVKKRPASPAPVRLDAWAMTRDRDRLHAKGGTDGDYHVLTGYAGGLPDVPAVLATWATWSIESGGPIRTTSITHVAGAAVQLAGAADHIAGQPWIDDYDAELRWLRRALRHAHGIEETPSLGRCLSVNNGRDCPGQVRDTGEGKPSCDRCGRRYGTSALVRLRVMNDMATS